MSYPALVSATHWSVLLLLVALAGTIAMGLLTGKINSTYLLWGIDKAGNHYFSPERVQLLVVTLGVAMQYVLQATHTKTGQMPALPEGSLALLGLSNATYLGGKAIYFRKTLGAGLGLPSGANNE